MTDELKQKIETLFKRVSDFDEDISIRQEDGIHVIIILQTPANNNDECDIKTRCVGTDKGRSMKGKRRKATPL